AKKLLFASISYVIRVCLFCRISNIGYDHFFQRNPSMLKGLIVIIDKLVIVIRVNKIAVFLCKNETGADMQPGQHSILRVLDQEHILVYIIEVLTLFVPQIGVGITVSDYLTGMLDADGTMISGHNDPHVLLRKPFKCIKQG